MATLPSAHQHILRTVWNSITDLQSSIPLLKSQIDTNKQSITQVTNNTNTSTSSETTIITSNTIGMVNDQTGLTAYTTLPSDYGAFVLVGDTSPVAVTLSSAGTSPGINLPWYCVLINTNSGLVTVTPSAGTISYQANSGASSMPLSQNEAAIIVYDGANFDSLILPVPPQNTPLVAHEWLDSYDNVSGAFGQSQPAFSDISGQIDPATQMPASGVVAGTYTLATVTVDAEGLVTAAASGPTGLSVTIVTAALTGGGTQGSMTFTGGVLTAQVPAT